MKNTLVVMCLLVSSQVMAAEVCSVEFMGDSQKNSITCTNQSNVSEVQKIDGSLDGFTKWEQKSVQFIKAMEAAKYSFRGYAGTLMTFVKP